TPFKRSISFYPQCGFLALGTRATRFKRASLVNVSIRNADFWLWEPRTPTSGCTTQSTVSIRNADFWLWELTRRVHVPVDTFLSAMRIFGFGNTSMTPSQHSMRWFLSAMRIFGFGNIQPLG